MRRDIAVERNSLGYNTFADLARAGGPEPGIDVGEDAVAQLNGREPLFLLQRDAVVGFVGKPDGFQFVELDRKSVV